MSSAKYVTYKEPIKIKEGAILNLVGKLSFTASNMPGTTQTAYHYVQVSKDDGVTWTSINTLSANLKSAYSSSASVSKSIDLDAYVGYDVLLRIATHHSASGATDLYVSTELTKFDITYQ